MTRAKLQFSAMTMTTALGAGLQTSVEALQQNQSGLTPCDFDKATLETFIGRIKGLETTLLPAAFKEYDSRNNRLALLALQQDQFESAVSRVKKHYSPERIGVVLGTTTSGFLSAEHAYQHRNASGHFPKTFNYRKTAHPFATAEFVRHYLGLQGPAQMIATACSSSAKAFVDAYRLIEMGFCDAVVVGGVDSLCLNTLYGFSSLDLLSDSPCKPADQNRSGLSIGEAAAFVLLEKPNNADIGLLGFGETSDAHHMSTPHPEGRGVINSMQKALNSAALVSQDIDYINWHGTASPVNDKVEDCATFSIFGNQTPCSSTKGWTGHTLGASGSVEAIISALCIQNNFALGSLNTKFIDPDFRSNYLLKTQEKIVKNVLTNSLGFGGNNCSLIIGEIP